MKVITGILLCIIIVALIGGSIVFGIYSSTNHHSYTGTVTEKAIKRSRDTDQYMIYTTLDSGETKVFKNVDSMLNGKYNSADVYAQMKVGDKYKFDVVGYRIPFWSMFENIIKVEGVK